MITTQQERMERYYRWHSRLYDLTRWSFLFGRRPLLTEIKRLETWPRVLEVGCGTGSNLRWLRHHLPQAELTGIDISRPMLQQAEKKLRPLTPPIQLQQDDYRRPLTGQFDLVLFSYVLTMINPGWEKVLATAQADLRPGGMVAVVDFHTSRWPIFQRWMALNHVQVAGQLLPMLHKWFHPHLSQTRPAYGGLWHYFLFIGEAKGQ